MFMGQKIQYCQGVNSLHIGLEIQHNPNENSSWFFVEIDKLILKFIYKCKGPKIAKINLKKSKVRKLIILDFDLSLNLQFLRQYVIGIKTEEQISGTEWIVQKFPLHMYGQLNFRPMYKANQMGESIVFNKSH